MTALDSDGAPQLVGNLVICNYNEAEGTEESLNDEDIRHLIGNIVILTEKTDRPDPQQWPALINVDQ